MRITFLICSMIVAACSGSGKPTDMPNDASSTASANASASATATTNPTGASNANGENPPPNGDCGGRSCASGETCVSYYGIAGARGPQFHDCVIPCKRGTPNDGCPEGKRCSTIADGPGDVCE